MKHNKQELLVYAIVWGLLFVAPVLTEYIATSGHDHPSSFSWPAVLFVWRQYALLLVAFIIHNFFLAPLLVARQRRQLYVSLVIVLIALFAVVQCAQRPAPENRPHDMEMESRKPPMDMNDKHMPPPAWDKPPMMLGQQDVVSLIILLLMLGMNIGVKFYFHHQKDRQQMEMLEKQNLQQQLEYLRYQINPHFLMNTLNNIHALIDINAEQAKESIVGLSKIMRFVLYEGAKQTVPLERELSFTRDYIELMRMRVTDCVNISVDLPEHVPNFQIPPLVLITFVENAFKHGVSYQQPSFINIHASLDDDHHLRFTCANSRQPNSSGQHGGVGLQNVRKRLELIYGDSYTLDISEEANTYNIFLLIPFLE